VEASQKLIFIEAGEEKREISDGRSSSDQGKGDRSNCRSIISTIDTRAFEKR
jgi:hypothetical protein